jgi:heme ABC exporter ATP-binding subunit CcmA
VIRARGLSVFFGRTIALDGLHLDIDEGVTGLFGPNGSGKSTLLRLAAGLLRPSRGTLTFDGRPAAASDEAFRRRVGYAGHLSGLYGHLSLVENLTLLARVGGAAPARVDQVIGALGLEGHASRETGALSAGLKRRAAVARALLSDPDLLLLDEPYANLDDDAVALTSAALRAWRGPGRVALIATHGAKELKRWADGGVVLRRGRVVVAGSYRHREPHVSEVGT